MILRVEIGKTTDYVKLQDEEESQESQHANEVPCGGKSESCQRKKGTSSKPESQKERSAINGDNFKGEGEGL